MGETKINQQRQVIEQCIDYLNRNELPTHANVREAINSIVGDKRQQILRHHKYWSELALRKGLESLIGASLQASIDICRHDAALGALAESNEFQNHMDHSVGHPAQKDVFAYCALAFGVRDTLKEIRRLRSDIADEISEIENQVFSADISEFVRKLRNNLLHGRVLVPDWIVSYQGERQTITGSMMYSKKKLTESGVWNAQSLNYIQSSNGEHLRLSVVVREHYSLLNSLKGKLQDLFAGNISLAEKDFWEIEDSHKRILRRQWAKILIGQIQNGKDPYDYLHRFFDPETVRKILCRPRHSKEQVDFMIMLKSTEIDFDDELRKMMYQVFGVIDESTT